MEVKATLCEVFCFVLEFVPLGYECAVQIRKERVAAICKALIKTIGTQDQQEVKVYRRSLSKKDLCSPPFYFKSSNRSRLFFTK